MAAGADLSLTAQRRDSRGKEQARKVRQQGRFPAVVYGGGGDSVAITLDTHDFQHVAQVSHGDVVMINLTYDDGASDKVLIKEVQRDPLSSRILHADLLRVDLSKPVTIAVHVVLVGETPLGVREGGLLEHIRHEINIEALPANIPAHIEMDISELELGHACHVSDLPALEGVTVLDPPDTVIAVIKSRAKIAEAEEAAAAAGEEEGAPEAEAAEEE